MSRSLVYTLHLWPPIAHAKHYTGSAMERQLARRLTDHALGRGARLTQVQVERGGSWVLAQAEPGGRTEERRLKQHGAARRCGVCKAADGYQSGQLTAAEALTRAGWDRASQHERGLLLDMFGLSQPPENLPAQPSPRPQMPAPGPARPVARSGPYLRRARPPTFTAKSLPKSWRWSASSKPPGPLSAEPRRRPRPHLRNRRPGRERSAPPQHAG